MTTLVVDASVAVKWFFPEIYSEAARQIVLSKREFLAPDLIWPEVGQALLKKVRRNEITSEEAADILRDFSRFPLQTYESKILLDTAWVLADRHGVSVYDALYLALAMDRDCSLVTADRKFYEALQKSSGRRLVWIEDTL